MNLITLSVTASSFNLLRALQLLQIYGMLEDSNIQMIVVLFSTSECDWCSWLSIVIRWMLFVSIMFYELSVGTRIPSSPLNSVFVEIERVLDWELRYRPVWSLVIAFLLITRYVTHKWCSQSTHTIWYVWCLCFYDIASVAALNVALHMHTSQPNSILLCAFQWLMSFWLSKPLHFSTECNYAISTPQPNRIAMRKSASADKDEWIGGLCYRSASHVPLNVQSFCTQPLEHCIERSIFNIQFWKL